MRSLLSKCLAVVMLMGLALLGSCVQDNGVQTVDPGPTEVSGTLLDVDGNPVSFADVAAYSGATLLSRDSTDEMGTFGLTGISGDLSKIDLRITHESFLQFSETVAQVLEKKDVKGKVRIQLLSGDDSCCGQFVITVKKGDGTVISDAQVKVRKNGQNLRTGYTNGDGVVTFSNICPGQYNLRIAKDGYQVKEPNMTIDDGGCDTVRETITLVANENNDTCCDGRLVVLARDSTSNDLLTGALVKLFKGGTLKATKEVTSNGAVFEGLCAGSYAIKIYRDGYPVREAEVNIECNANIERTYKLLANDGGGDTCCRGRLKILVKDSASTQILVGATAKLYKNGQLKSTKTTTQSGVVWEELCEGNYTVVIVKDGYNPIEFVVEMGCNSNKELTKLLAAEGGSDECCHGWVKIFVKNSNGERISGATVKLWKGSQLIETGTTNNDGYVAIDGLCQADNYSVSINRTGYKGMEFSFEMGCDDRKEFTKILEFANTVDTCETASLKLRITNDGGEWINGATVKIYRNNALVYQGTSEGEGWFLKEGLIAPASYVVRVTKDGYNEKVWEVSFNECKRIQETLKLLQ